MQEPHLYYLIYVGGHFPVVLWQILRLEFLQQMVINVPPSWTHFLQKMLVWLGMAGSLVMSYKLGRAQSDRLLHVLGEFLPHAVVAVSFAIVLQKVIADFFYSG